MDLLETSCLSINPRERKPQKLSLEVSPNPVKNILNISINQDFDDDVLIYNSTGGLVMQLPSIEKRQSIDVSQLTSGIYVIKTEKSNLITKFIKL